MIESWLAAVSAHAQCRHGFNIARDVVKSLKFEHLERIAIAQNCTNSTLQNTRALANDIHVSMMVATLPLLLLCRATEVNPLKSGSPKPGAPKPSTPAGCQGTYSLL